MSMQSIYDTRNCASPLPPPPLTHTPTHPTIYPEIEHNIKELAGDTGESIMRQMQKTILSNLLHISRMIKLSG